MENLNYDIINMKGDKVGSIDLDPAVFQKVVDQSIIHSTVRWQLDKRRAGTHSAKNRTAMTSCSGRKLYNQKGTGRARAGSKDSPTRVGGAVAHGPTPRSYEKKLPKATRRQALCALLSAKVTEKKLVIVDEIKVESAKTRDMAVVLSSIGVAGQKALIVTPEKTSGEGVWRSSQNISDVLTLPVAGVNAYDLLRHNCLVCTVDAVKALQERLTSVKAECQVEAA